MSTGAHIHESVVCTNLGIVSDVVELCVDNHRYYHDYICLRRALVL